MFFSSPINASVIFGRVQHNKTLDGWLSSYLLLSHYFPCPHREWFYALLTEYFSYAIVFLEESIDACVITPHYRCPKLHWRSDFSFPFRFTLGTGAPKPLVRVQSPWAVTERNRWMERVLLNANLKINSDDFGDGRLVTVCLVYWFIHLWLISAYVHTAPELSRVDEFLSRFLSSGFDDYLTWLTTEFAVTQ